MGGTNEDASAVQSGSLTAGELEGLNSIDPEKLDARYVWTVGRKYVDKDGGSDGLLLSNYRNGSWFIYDKSSDAADELIKAKTRQEAESSSANERLKYNNGTVTFAGNRMLTYKNDSYYATKIPDGETTVSGAVRLQAYVWKTEGMSATGNSNTGSSTGEYTWVELDASGIVDGGTYAFTVPVEGETKKYVIAVTKDGYGTQGWYHNLQRVEYDPDDAAFNTNSTIYWTIEKTNNGKFYMYQVFTEENKPNGLEAGVRYYVCVYDSGDYGFKRMIVKPITNKSEALEFYIQDSHLRTGDGTYQPLLVTRADGNTKDDLMLISAQNFNGDISCYADFKPHTFEWKEMVGFGNVSYTVINESTPGVVLPATGGMGTFWFYILGLAVFGTVSVLVYRKTFY